MNDLERLLNYYLAGRFYLPKPRYLCFQSTMRCDGRCGHCGIWSRKEPMEEIGAEALEQVLAGRLFERVETAWITGGEPTLREDLSEVARTMAATLPALSTLGISTNGFNPDRVTAGIEAMLAVMAGRVETFFAHVSLDGVGEVYDRVRRKTGLFDSVSETISRIERLRDRTSEPRIEIGFNCVMQPGNVDGLAELHEYARDRGVPITFNVAMVTDQIYNTQHRAEQLTLSPEDRAKITAFLDSIMDESPPAFKYQYRIIKEVLAGRPRPRRCLTLYSTINVNADGTLIPCPASSELFPKNIVKEDAEKIWKSSEAKTMRRMVHAQHCPSCMLSCSLGDSMPLGEWIKGGWD